jgi:hypothetical protein
VLRGSNPRPTPCKGAALPTELSTHSLKLLDRVFQGLAGAEFWNLGRLDRDGLASARIAASALGTLGHIEGTEPHQRHAVALLERRLDRADQGLEGTARSRLRNVGLIGNVLDQF